MSVLNKFAMTPEQRLAYMVMERSKKSQQKLADMERSKTLEQKLADQRQRVTKAQQEIESLIKNVDGYMRVGNLPS